MIYGYARVSTVGQSLEAQREQLKAAGVDQIFAEKRSGADDARPQLKRLMKIIDDGDVLIVTRLDRFARSTRHLLELVDEIHEAGATFKSLAEAWADSTTPHGRLLLTFFAGMADFERHLITERTGQGRERAKKAGVKFGPKFKLTEHQRAEAMKRKAKGQPHSLIAKSYAVDRSTITRLR